MMLQPPYNITYSPQCSLFMAPSSIPNAGFGIFTTLPIAAGSPIQPYPDAPSIPVLDPDAHCKQSLSKYSLRNWAQIEYFWSGDGHIGFEALQSEDNVVTMGALSNYHPFLYNVKPKDAGYDDSFGNTLVRQDLNTSPQLGAFSYYPGQVFVAVQNIAAGGEIFADYGESWLDTRPDTFADYIPRKDDYHQASKILNQVLAASRNICHNSTCQDALLSLVRSVTQQLNSRISSLLPSNMDIIQSSMNNNPKVPLERILAQSTIQPRNVSWIQEHGMCLDHLVPQRSTMPLAGMGAFSQRVISKDSRIVPVPLLQIPYRESLLMYPLLDESSKGRNPVNTQLLLNYCFGHPNMTMLLCPTTNAILINHCSDRKPDLFGGQCAHDQGPNAKIVWAPWDPLTDSWRHKTIQEIDTLTEQSHRGLSLDIMALRDILPGEEVLLDYGTEWEEEWEFHIKTWKSIKTTPKADGTTSSLGSVYEMNRNKTMEIKTMKQLIDSPYPDNVQTACIYKEYEDTDVEKKSKHKELGRFSDHTPLYEVEHGSKDIIVTNDGYRFIAQSDGRHTFWPCDVIERDAALSFTVRIITPHWDAEDDCPSWSKSNHARLVSNYPLDSIKFVPKKYKSDLFLDGVFRHYIGIPDDMISEEWTRGPN